MSPPESNPSDTSASAAGAHRADIRSCLLLIGGIALFYGALFVYPSAWRLLIGSYYLPAYSPFLDMQGQLASCEGWARGMDVLNHPNPLDPRQRRHLGPVWMLWPGLLGVRTDQYLVFGAVSLLLCFAAVVWVLRPANVVDAAVALVVLTTPGIGLLVERGNVDLWAFVLFAVLLGLMTLANAGRMAAIGLISAFIGFKYYPVMAYGLLLERARSMRRLRWELMAAVLACCLFLALFWRETLEVARVNSQPVIWSFGASSLVAVAGFERGQLLLSVLLIGLLGTLVARLLGPLSDSERRSTRSSLAFFLGAGTLLFCFVAASSLPYRLIFFLLCLPWLLERGRGAAQSLERWACWSAIAAFVAAPWVIQVSAKFIRSTKLAPQARLLLMDHCSVAAQVLWWVMMAVLTGLYLRLVVARATDHLFPSGRLARLTGLAAAPTRQT